jgi:DNA modification methylase
MQTNVLYYGDNLEIPRRYIPDASVDLVYLDPPFNSNRDYNVIFRDESGTAVQLCGHQGYGYKGQFDQSGTDYYNAFWNSLYGKASGGWTCYISWNIRKTFSGWHRDNWCDSGRR